MLVRRSLFLYFFIFTLGLILTAHSIGAEPVYKALNPRGIRPDIKLVPLSKRLPDLKNKVVYIVNPESKALNRASDARSVPSTQMGNPNQPLFSKPHLMKSIIRVFCIDCSARCY